MYCKNYRYWSFKNGSLYQIYSSIHKNFQMIFETEFFLQKNIGRSLTLTNFTKKMATDAIDQPLLHPKNWPTSWDEDPDQPSQENLSGRNTGQRTASLTS